MSPAFFTKKSFTFLICNGSFTFSLKIKKLASKYGVKVEVLNETVVNKSTDLVKTICSDLKQDHSEKVSQLIDKLKNIKSRGNNINPNVEDSDIDSENEGRPQCVHQ